MADERRFFAAFNRFQWERLVGVGTDGGSDTDAGSGQAGDLTLCQSVLRIDQVDSVQYRGLDGELGGVKFELLTIQSEAMEQGGFQITLVFAGDVALRLQVSEVTITLQDFEEPWPAGVTPRHDFADIPPSDS